LSFRTCFAVSLLTSLVPLAPAASVFNFDNDPAGLSTPFTDTNNNVSASFSSSVDPGGFVVTQTFFVTLTGNVLLVPGPRGVANTPLDVAFNTNLGSVNLAFALNAGASTPMLLEAFLGGNPVGSASALGTVPSGGFGFPEGTIHLNGITFDSIRLSSPNAINFAVDDISVAPPTTVTPEPATASLLALALIVALTLSLPRPDSSERMLRLRLVKNRL
jgi:hypothetical protein